MAHKKAGGSSRNGRDSKGKRLGIKAFGGEVVIPGNIIARQRGTTWHPGLNVGMGTDHTLFAKIEGRVDVPSQSQRPHLRIGTPDRRRRLNRRWTKFGVRRVLDRTGGVHKTGSRGGGKPASPFV